MNAEPILCAHCDSDTSAVQFLEVKADYDPACQMHYDAMFTECPSCSHVVHKDDVVAIETSRQTWSEPAEYTDVCSHCGPHEGPERNEDC